MELPLGRRIALILGFILMVLAIIIYFLLDKAWLWLWAWLIVAMGVIGCTLSLRAIRPEIRKMWSIYDLCVRCGEETEYLPKTPIQERQYYVEGAGQLCDDCGKRYG